MGDNIVVFDTARIRGQLARLPQVRAAVLAKTAEIGVTAETLFAAHDHPGGHSIEVEHGHTDGFVSLIGPAPLSVEFGHFTRHSNEHPRKFVKGLHILARAARL